MPHGHRPRRPGAALAVAVAAALALTACGATTANSNGTPGQPAAQPTTTGDGLPGHDSASASTAPGGEVTSARPNSRSGGTASGGNTTTTVARGTEQPGSADESNPRRAKPVDPCRYVTAGEASAAFHAAIVTETVGTLGPTCIFTAGPGGRQLGTLAIGVRDVPAQVKSMRNARRTNISRHAAYCGRLGSPLLLIAIAGGRALSIQAPCSEASALAASVLPHITL